MGSEDDGRPAQEGHRPVAVDGRLELSDLGNEIENDLAVRPDAPAGADGLDAGEARHYATPSSFGGSHQPEFVHQVGTADDIPEALSLAADFRRAGRVLRIAAETQTGKVQAGDGVDPF